MRILITGGSGLVGRYVVQGLVNEHEVEVVDLKPFPHTDIPYHCIDLLDETKTKDIVKGFDAVVHLAGIPHPLNVPAETVFRTNTIGTFHLLQACSLHDVKRFIFMSSESTLGFAFSTTRMWPMYVPIDEHHPLRPQDPYGLSKMTGELLCAGFTRKSCMQTISLRAPWIWVPEKKEVEFYKELRREYHNWYKNLWAYIHVHDVVEAIRLTLLLPFSPSADAFFITAEENWTGKESRKLMEQFFPETREIRGTLNGSVSLISNVKARSSLGFAPQFSWRDIVRQTE